MPPGFRPRVVPVQGIGDEISRLQDPGSEGLREQRHIGQISELAERAGGDAPLVDPALQGATTLIRVNSTKKEIANNPHTRRSLSLRAIPEADPHFAEIFGAREDIESAFSNLKYPTRGKLKSIYEDQDLFSLTAYMLLWMSRARAAYYKSVAANPAQAIPIAA